MATRGRRPKPTALHELHGTKNVTRHRQRSEEPIPVGDLLAQPPDFLTDGQAAAWSFAVTNAPKGVMKCIDRGVLLVWVEAEDRHRRAIEAQALLDQRQPQMPFLIMHKKRGELTLSPYLSVINAAGATMLRAAAELGFSPAARPRLVGAKTGDGATNESPFQQLRLMQGGKT